MASRTVDVYCPHCGWSIQEVLLPSDPEELSNHIRTCGACGKDALFICDFNGCVVTRTALQIREIRHD